jgi:hypothetical protein
VDSEIYESYKEGELSMFDAIKPLLESGIINEDTHRLINEAWESKLNEAREQVRSELREEFAQKYEHDREIMVEALDKMITASLQSEITEFQEEKRAMTEDRVRQYNKLRETATKFNDFMVKKLAEEIKEMRNDRKLQLENQSKLESFVVKHLAKEIGEFKQDQNALVEAKVKLVSEGRQQIELLKKKFVNENSSKVKNAVLNYVKGEMQQLKEDIKVARENDFGRKIFESFASEFSVTHLNEKIETRNLMAKLQKREEQLRESINKLNESKSIIDKKEREVRIIKESVQRDKTMNDLLSTLNKDKSQTMRTLLENVQTKDLSKVFQKYLPAVLNNGETVASSKKAMITEGVQEVTGNKTAKVDVNVDLRDNVIDLKRLAGL